MKTLPTFKEQFDKITEAYIKGEINPTNSMFCFCGTLCDNNRGWFHNPIVKHNDFMYYTGEQYVAMEKALFREICTETWHLKNDINSKEYQEDLFNGMCAALEVLKQIHIEHGENIEEPFEFKKRELVV